MLLAVDQGLVNGHATIADVLFLAAFVLALVSAILYWLPKSLAAAFLSIAVALAFLGWFVL
jgi:hypothetical protein